MKDLFIKFKYKIIELIFKFFKLTILKKIQLKQYHIILITFILCCLFFLSLPIYVADKGQGSQNLAKFKNVVHRAVSGCRKDIVYFTGSIQLINNNCQITIYGNKINLTLDENQGKKINNRITKISNKDKNKINEYNFCKKLFDKTHNAHRCNKNEECKNVFLFTKKELINDHEGRFKTFAEKLFTFQQTKNLQSVSFAIYEPTDEIQKINTRSLVILMNHNDISDLKCEDGELVVDKIEEGNFMQKHKDPERLMTFITEDNIIDRIENNIKITKIKIRQLFY